MAATGNVTVTASVTGAPTGDMTYYRSTAMSNAQPAVTVVSLASGNNTVTVPAGATVAIIVPPNATSPQPNPNYGGVLTLKGAGGDTGVVISSYGPTVLNWQGTILGAPSPPASIVINATATGTLEVWFA